MAGSASRADDLMLSELVQIRLGGVVAVADLLARRDELAREETLRGPETTTSTPKSATRIDDATAV